MTNRNHSHLSRTLFTDPFYVTGRANGVAVCPLTSGVTISNIQQVPDEFVNIVAAWRGDNEQT